MALVPLERNVGGVACVVKIISRQHSHLRAKNKNVSRHHPARFWEPRTCTTCRRFRWRTSTFAALTCTGKAILLDDIIDALERDADHFQPSTITYVVGERDDLYARLVQAGVLVL